LGRFSFLPSTEGVAKIAVVGWLAKKLENGKKNERWSNRLRAIVNGNSICLPHVQP
jgi:hypothetical protein